MAVHSMGMIRVQGSYRLGKTGKSQGICVVRERSGKNILKSWGK